MKLRMGMNHLIVDVARVHVLAGLVLSIIRKSDGAVLIRTDKHWKSLPFFGVREIAGNLPGWMVTGCMALARADGSVFEIGAPQTFPARQVLVLYGVTGGSMPVIERRKRELITAAVFDKTFRF